MLGCILRNIKKSSSCAQTQVSVLFSYAKTHRALRQIFVLACPTINMTTVVVSRQFSHTGFTEGTSIFPHNNLSLLGNSLNV